MKASKQTKRALIPSILAVIMCVAMLIGTTFAWFTDTASTSVNKIQAGKLDVALYYANGKEEDGTTTKWDNAEGKTLGWVQATDAEGTTVFADEGLPLWEPGATFTLPELKIVNEGNLVLKYWVEISGIQGDTELNDVIDWVMTLKGSDGKVRTESKLTDDHALAVGAYDTFTISGKMRESAGNEYQGKSIDNIAITVYATQKDSEFDSQDNKYDENAKYSALIPVLNEKTTATKTAQDADITIASTISTSTAAGETAATATTTISKDTGIKTATAIDSGVENIDKTSATDAEQISVNDSISRVLKTTEATANSVTYDIGFIYTKTTTSQSGTTSTSYNVSAFSAPVTNKIKLSAGLANVKVTHTHGTGNAAVVTSFTAASSDTDMADKTYYYDATSGWLTICSSEYSYFEIDYANNFKAAVNGQGYDSFDAALAAAEAAEEAQTIILLDNATTASPQINKAVTLDLSGKTLTATGQPQVSGVLTIKDSGTGGQLALGAGMMLNEGKLVLNSGTIACSGTGEIFLMGGAKFEMNGGSLTAETGACIDAAYATNGAEVTINGGLVETTSTTTCAVYIADRGGASMTAKITGGTIKSASDTAVMVEGTNSTLTISGGTFEGNIVNESGTVNFNGGTFNGDIVNKGGTVFFSGKQNKLNRDVMAVVTTEDQLKAAVDIAKIKTIKLGSDITVANEIAILNKKIIDLNGHTITLKYGEGASVNNGGVFNVIGQSGKLTINDSSEAQTGAVIGSDKTCTNKVTCAVRVCNYGKLTINGGHFYGTSEGTSCIYVCTSQLSSTKATVTINGGTFETKTPYSGTYFVLNHEDSMTAGCTITVNGGSFKNYNPGVTAVDTDDNNTGKISLGTGCTTTSKTDGTDTWYTVSK